MYVPWVVGVGLVVYGQALVSLATCTCMVDPAVWPTSTLYLFFSPFHFRLTKTMSTISTFRFSGARKVGRIGLGTRCWSLWEGLNRSHLFLNRETVSESRKQSSLLSEQCMPWWCNVLSKYCTCTYTVLVKYNTISKFPYIWIWEWPQQVRCINQSAID